MQSLSDFHRDQFERKGLVRLPGLLPQDVVSPVREVVRELLERNQVCRDGVWTAGRQHGMTDVALKTPLLRKLNDRMKQSTEFAALCTAEVHAAAEQLVDDRTLVTVVNRPQILFTPPDAERWELPHKVWHMDVPRLGDTGCPGVQMFTFIERVDPGGAGTVVATGSHRYVNGQGKVRSKQVKKRLRKENQWFRGLFRPDGQDRRRFLDAPMRDGDVELQVVELTGEPGDVWLMDLRLLHSLAPNTSDRPRLMATQRYFLAGVAEAAYSGAD